MDKQLLEYLESIKMAKDKYHRILLSRETNYEKYVNYEDPKYRIDIPPYNGPDCPSMPFEPGTIEALKKEYYEETPLTLPDSKVRWKPRAIIWVISIVCLWLGCIGIISTSFVMAAGDNNVGGLIAGVVFLISGILIFGISVLVTRSKSKKIIAETTAKTKMEIESENAFVKQHNEEIKVKIKELEKKMEQYEADKAEYDKSWDEYQRSTADLREKQSRLESEQRSRSREMVERENKEKEILANNIIKEALEKDGNYFPKNYLSAIDQLIAYIKNLRADTLKEAINLYESENRENLRDLERAFEHTYLVDFYCEGIYGGRLVATKRVRAKDAADACAQVPDSICARRED